MNNTILVTSSPGRCCESEQCPRRPARWCSEVHTSKMGCLLTPYTPARRLALSHPSVSSAEAWATGTGTPVLVVGLAIRQEMQAARARRAAAAEACHWMRGTQNHSKHADLDTARQ